MDVKELGEGLSDFLDKLLGRKKRPPLDMEKAVGKYLLELPRCAGKVVVASPKYGDPHYRCEVLVDSAKLLPWVEHHAQATWYSHQEVQAAKLAIPLWLRGANLIDFTPSYAPRYFVEVLQPYTLNFIEKGFAEVVCPDCQRVVKDIEMKSLDERKEGNWRWWTSEWICPNGHLLYREDHELKFFCKTP